MNILEHSVTLLSIIIGLGLTEMFGNLHKLIRNRTRVTWDWLPVAWGATLLILVINYWWSIYLGVSGFNQVRNAGEFGLALVPPILLFLTTASVLPNFEGNAEWDMRCHYDEQRKTFIITFALYQCSTWIAAFVTGTIGWNVISVVRGIILALLVSMLLLNKRRWDWVGVLAILVVLIYRLTTQAVR
ncbi:MAG: hypothetical protein EOP58_13110 [Sphingomonadales bacterium]|nr:MAG: hypothetical protein EOP58_13110 [Sphingomonadales bacterium]